MITQTFEIKVALLGYVSVGKTTVLNALLQDKFSEVSMRRTTAGVNFFRIVNQLSEKASATDTTAREDSKSTPAADEMQWSPLADEPVHTATATLAEITQDNEILRQETTVQEKTFNIALNEPLCEMRKDTTLVLVDVPGLNEAGSKQMYLKYVSEKWDTFDCVVVAMDAEKGVNTEEQVELLHFVKAQLGKSKRMPVLVLCNKVDDPDDDELMQLVGEVRSKVEQIFNVDSRVSSLNQVLTAFREGKRCSGESVYPVFIPLSAGNAFAYRTAASCSLDKFTELDVKLIDKIGRDQVGRPGWKKLAPDQKHKIVYDVMSDATQYQEHLESTNFDKFLIALSYAIGGDDVQKDLINTQIQVSLTKLSSMSLVVDQLQTIYDKCKAINRNPRELKDAFWIVFKRACNGAINLLKGHIDSPALAITFDQMIAYISFVRNVGWNEEEETIIKQMVLVVRQQIGVVLDKERRWKIEGAALARYKWVDRTGSLHGKYFPWDWQRVSNGWRNYRTNKVVEITENPDRVVLSWKSLTYHDWATILGSMLLMASNRHFCERFGREKIVLERLLQRHSMFVNGVASGKTAGEVNALANIPAFSEGVYRFDGEFVPREPVKYGLVAQVVAPELISDPSHWGHVIWKFCLFMEDNKHTTA